MTNETMDAMTDHLGRLGVSDWRAALLRWCGRYDGLEQLVGCNPQGEILAQLAAMEPPITDEDVAARLATCDFLTWRVRRDADRANWNALDGTLEQFGFDPGRCAVWQSSEEYPPREITATWLLEQLAGGAR